MFVNLHISGDLWTCRLVIHIFVCSSYSGCFVTDYIAAQPQTAFKILFPEFGVKVNIANDRDNMDKEPLVARIVLLADTRSTGHASLTATSNYELTLFHIGKINYCCPIKLK